MTTLREAAQQALEALEAMQSYAAAERKGLRICDEALAALRAALAQQDEPVLVQGELPPRYVARSPIQAEPVEPVAWVGDPSTQDYASTQPEPDAYGYASRLAVAIWEKHYKDAATQWKPLDDLMGVLTQIDNMTSGLTRLAQQAEPVEDVLLSAAGLALDALEHDRQAAARAGRSISMLSSRAIEELRGAFRAALAQQDELQPMPPEQRQRWEELAAMPQQAEPLNLADPAVRKRLATQWGYVPAAQAEPVEQLAELQAMLRAEVDRLIAAGIQPQRKPLTQEEIERIGMKHVTLREVIRAVERAHGIKE